MFNKFLENVLTEDECDSIIKMGLSSELKSLTTTKFQNGKAVMVDVDTYKNKRRGSYFVNKDLDNKVLSTLSDNILRILNDYKPFNGVEYNGVSKYTFNEYSEGDFLGWHADLHEIQFGATSTIIVQLNDDYEGGDILYKINDEILSVPKSRGSVFIFDSNLEHSISEITNGMRYSMNCWPTSIIKKQLF
jgi:PKHD-type hydroxylase